MKFHYFICILILHIRLSSEFNLCRLQKECNNEDSIRCGICVNSATLTVAKCIFPFSAVYKPDKSCSKVQVCEDEHCGGHGKCQLTAANYKQVVPFCKCDQDFYGWTCQQSAATYLSGVFFTYIEFPFEGVKNPVERHMRQMYLYCGSQESVSQGYLEVISDDKGHYQRIFINRKLCASAEWITYWYETRYQYKSFYDEDDNKVLKLEEDVLGYLSSYKITVNIRGFINYQHEFPVFVSYKEANLECVPVVKIQGCPPSKRNEETITRSHGVKLISSVHFITDGKYTTTSTPNRACANRAHYSWKMWKNEDNDSDTTYLKYYNIKELDFPPFTLEISYYRILLEVTSVQEKSSQNYAYCYFNMKYEPIVAIIDGGCERVVQKRLGLVLTTTRSTDPNMDPKDQRHMKASWSCVDILDHNREICDPSKDFPVSNSHFVPPEKLQFGAVIKITLTVWTDYYNNCETCGTVRPALATATIHVANKSSNATDDIYIQCLQNCDVKVITSEQLYLKVKTTGGTILENCLWTFYAQGEKEEDTATIELHGLPSFMLVVKANALTAGKNYTIVVNHKKNNLMAKYSFETVGVSFKGNCSMYPMNGTRGISMFNLKCENFATNGHSLRFELYDKTSSEAQEGLLFSGRMVGTSNDGEFSNFKITRGHVFVYIKYDGGLFTQQQFIVNLSSWEVNEEIVEEIFSNITKAKHQQDLVKMVEYISIIPDVVSTEMNKSRILERILHHVNDFPTNTLSDVKVTASTLKHVILELSKPVYLKVKPGLMSIVVHIIQKQAGLLSLTVDIGTEVKVMSSVEIKQIATTLLTCLRAILLCKDPRTVGMTEFDLSFETEDILMQISNTAEEVIHTIQNVLTSLLRPGLRPINITSQDNTYAVWGVINDEDYDLTHYLAGGKGNVIPVSVSKDFLKEFEKSTSKKQNEVAFRIAELDNIFWWRKSDVKSNLVSVSLAKRSLNKMLSKVEIASKPLHVKFSLNGSLLNTTEMSDITFHYQYNMTCSLDLDLAIKIHRLDPTPKSLITVRFLYPQTNGSLKVRVYRNHRPDCEMMKKAVEISEQTPNYPPVLVRPGEPTFFYIGIIPGPSYINQNVRYTFQVNTTVCQHWVRGYWSSQGCDISTTMTKDLKVYCKCNHFSIFAAAFPVPPQEVDPFTDITLFLTVFDNPVVVLLVSFLLLIYLTACLWAFCKDRNDDRMLRTVVILEDNFPGGNYPYLLAVYTSSRFNAGTTAHVGIKLIGSSSTSRAHILASSERKTLKRNYDDWFLIYCSENLGELRSIHVWHDNSGSSPDWFCDKIFVYDLKGNLDAEFVVEQWLDLRHNCYPEANASAATISEVKNIKRMFVDNFVLGLREKHVLLSIVLRHPRSAMSRLQKISVLMCCIMVAMLCGIMFYSAKVDEDDYNVEMRDFYISLQSLVVCISVTFLVLLAFKKSYKLSYQRSRSTTLYRASLFKEYDALQYIHQKNTFYASYVRFVSKILKGHPLLPVQLTKHEQTVKRRNIFFMFAWSSCTVVILTCSFFVMLYGLKLGLVKSQKWLYSVLLSVGGEILIVGPIKILIISMFLSMAFQNISKTNTHRVYAVDALRVQIPVDMEQYEENSTKRNHPMYAPLRHDVTEKMIRTKEVRSKCLHLFDLIVSLVFIIVLSIVMYEIWSSHYHNNRHVKTIVTKSQHSRITTVNFFSIRNVTEMEVYLNTTLVRLLYVKFWYNKMPIIEEGYWMEDFTHRMVGEQRLRQIRVTSVRCTLLKVMNTSRRCIPRWAADHEDTQDYTARWRIAAQWHDLQAKNSPWKYTTSSHDMLYTTYRLYGESGTLYHDGGYLTYLGPGRSKTMSTTTDMNVLHWQDQLTRAVFVEFTLFNVNKNLFSQVTVIVEYLISGKIQLKTEVVSTESKIKASIWNGLLAVFIIYYVVRSGDLINRQGLMEFLAYSGNQIQVLVIVLGASCFVVATVHYFSSAAEYDDFMKSGKNSFFDFDSYVFYFLRLHELLSLLFCFAILRSVLILLQGRSLVIYLNTLKLSASRVLCVTAVIVVFLLLHLYWLLLLYIYSFHTIRGVIINSILFERVQHIDVGTGMFFLVKSVFLSSLLKFYFLIFTHSFRIARHIEEKKSKQCNFKACIF